MAAFSPASHFTHCLRRVGRERQLHLRVRALCGEMEKVFDVLVDIGAQVSLVKAIVTTVMPDHKSEDCHAEGSQWLVHGGWNEGS